MPLKDLLAPSIDSSLKYFVFVPLFLLVSLMRYRSSCHIMIGTIVARSNAKRQQLGDQLARSIEINV